MANRQRTWTPMVLTQLLVVLAVLVAGIVSAAVVGTDDDSHDDVLRVADTAAAAGTFRTTYALEVAGAGLSFTSVGELYVDTTAHAEAGHVRAPLLGSIEVRHVGDRVYVRIPPTRPAAQGKHWAALPADSAGSVTPQDPVAFLRVLQDGADVREVGKEDVNGTSTTHYTVTLEPKQVADFAAQNPSAAALPPGVLDRVRDVKTDIWVDAQNRPRRVRVVLKVQSFDVRTSFEFHDYGKPVDVSAPPPSDVLDLSDPQQLARLLASSG